jgi:hypothetical protein
VGNKAALRLAQLTFTNKRRSSISCPVESGEKRLIQLPTFKFDDWMPSTVGVTKVWSSDMLVRPRDLADRISDGQALTITLPLEAARRKAREIIDRSPHSGLAAVIEKWRQLPDGRIEFAIRHFQSED